MRIRWNVLLSFAVLLACKGASQDSGESDSETGTSSDDTTGGQCLDCGAVEWVVDLSASNAVSAYDVEVDGAGNVVVVGAFNETLEIEGETLVSAGGFDAFVARFSPTGELQWAHAFGGPNADGVSGVGLDGDGNIHVFGGLSGEVDLGGGTLANPDSLTAWVAIYDPSGEHLFSQLMGNGGQLFAIGLDALPDGSSAICGYYEGTPDFGDGALAEADNRDAFVVKLDADGSAQWSRGFGSSDSTSLDYAGGVALSPDGSMHVSLGIEGALDLGEGPINAADDGDGVLITLDPDGALRSSRVLASDAKDSIAEAAVSGSGAVLVTGEVRALGADFGEGEPKATGGTYAASFDADGEHVWSRVFTPGLTRPWGIAGVGASDVVIAAQYDGATDFGGGPLPDSGDADVVVARYADDGTHLWSRSFGGMENAFGAAVAGAPDDGLVVVGDYNGTIEFDDTMFAATGRSGFVAKLSP
jgi:hypothetical protein